jgi:glycosyltransferase involved in cell wall biosynthesis
MNLTLAIPTHNDLDNLCCLLARAHQLDCVTHVVVVDDGSDIPIPVDVLLRASGWRADQLTLLRHNSARGPGVARNRALEYVPSAYVLFMDSDDLPTRELPHLLLDLDGQDFDFCLFQHHDTRLEREHSWSHTAHDQALWHAAGVEVGALTPVSPTAGVLLARTANYPWNKIYRTDFLLRHGIGCSDIMVHEDIELHWRSFLKARRILASDRIAVIHVFHETGGRLTNRIGPERLEVFGPLGQIAEEITTNGPPHYAVPFFHFVIGLFDWIPNNLRPALQSQFAEQVQDFVHNHIPYTLRAGIARTDPDLEAWILEKIATNAANQDRRDAEKQEASHQRNKID